MGADMIVMYILSGKYLELAEFYMYIDVPMTMGIIGG